MKVMTFNVGIWTRNARRSDGNYWKPRAKAMKRMITALAPDVICFQELWWPHNLYIPKSYRKVFGTGWEHPIYVKKGLKARYGMTRLMWSYCDVEGVDIFSVHSHWKEDAVKETCEGVWEMAQHSDKAVAAGDYNTGVNTVIKYLPMSSARAQMGYLEKDTFVNFTRPESHGEIDHLMTKGVQPTKYRIVHHTYGSKRMSDHYPIMITI